mgnify:FL=1
MQHESPSGNARGERDAHLAHGAGVDQHAGFGDDTADFLGKQCFSGEADVGYGVVERICRGFDEFGGAGSHVIGVDDVERRTKFVQQAFGSAAMERDFTLLVHVGAAGQMGVTAMAITSCLGLQRQAGQGLRR